MRLLSALRDTLLVDLLCPLCAAGPRWLWPATAGGVAVLGAPWVALRRRAELQAILRATGRTTGLRDRLALGAAMLHRRLRRLDLYLQGAPAPCTLTWQGEPPDRQRACYVVMDVQGCEQLSSWVGNEAFFTVRRRFGAEEPGEAAAPAPASRWLARCDLLRGSLGRGHVIDTARGPAELRRLYRSGRNLLFFQGSPSADPTAPLRPWLGQQMPVVLGAVRLARRESLPLRFVQLRPTLTGWTIEVEAAVEPDEGWLLARMQRQLCECPQSWSLWADFLAVAGQPPAAMRLRRMSQASSASPTVSGTKRLSPK